LPSPGKPATIRVMDDTTELATIDSKDAMQRFMADIQERASSLAPNCLERTQPDVAAKAMWLLAQGASFTKVRQITGVGHETLRRLSWDHKDTLDSKRKEFSMRYAIAAQEYTDLLFKKAEQLYDDPEQLAQVRPDHLATTVGIMQDKAAALAGITGNDLDKKAGISIEDAAALIAEVKARVAQRQHTQVIDAVEVKE
jgi:hypothetical protein